MGLNYKTIVKAYTITIPTFTMVVIAENKTEALEQFWFDFDAAQEDPEWRNPIIRVTDKKHGVRHH
jgi:hypothetical protein